MWRTHFRKCIMFINYRSIRSYISMIVSLSLAHVADECFIFVSVSAYQLVHAAGNIFLWYLMLGNSYLTISQNHTDKTNKCKSSIIEKNVNICEPNVVIGVCRWLFSFHFRYFRFLLLFLLIWIVIPHCVCVNWIEWIVWARHVQTAIINWKKSKHYESFFFGNFYCICAEWCYCVTNKNNWNRKCM